MNTKSLKSSFNRLVDKFNQTDFQHINLKNYSTQSPKKNNAIQALEYRYDQSIIALKDSFDKVVELEINEKSYKESIEFKSNFLAKMAHDLRTPLNGVIGMIEILKLSDYLQGSDRNQVDMLSRSSDQLLSIVNETLDFSKLEAGILDIQAKTHHLIDNLLEIKNIHF